MRLTKYILILFSILTFSFFSIINVIVRIHGVLLPLNYIFISLALILFLLSIKRIQINYILIFYIIFLFILLFYYHLLYFSLEVTLQKFVGFSGILLAFASGWSTRLIGISIPPLANRSDFLIKIIKAFLIAAILSLYFVYDFYAGLINPNWGDGSHINTEGKYQFAGDTLAIFTIFSSWIYCSAIRKHFLNYKITAGFFDILLIFLFHILSFLAAQAFGSNKGAAIILISLIAHLACSFSFQHWEKISRKSTYPSIVWLLTNKKILFNFAFFLVIMIVGLKVISIYVDLSGRFRIFQKTYGDEFINTSLDSRLGDFGIVLLSFMESPLYGNLLSGDFHTFLSAFSSTGLLGGFLIFFGVFLNGFMSHQRSVYSLNKKTHFYMSLYGTLIFFGVFLLSLISSYFTWAPMWFVMGLLFGGVKFGGFYQFPQSGRG